VKKKQLVATGLVLCMMLLSAVVQAAETRTYVDMDGTEVPLPTKIERIVNLWGANHQMITLLGHSDTLVGTTSYMKSLPWFIKFCPHIVDVPVVITAEQKVNIEEILRLNPDVVITTRKRVDELRNAGLTVVNLYFDDYAGLKETVKKTAELFGDKALEKAQAYIDYFNGNLERVKKVTDAIPEGDRKKILYIRPAKGSGYLTTDGKGTMASQWADLAGGVNIADEAAEGWGKTLTMEYVLSEDPDVIILMDKGAIPAKEYIMNNPAWTGIKAVRNKQVFVNPSAVFYWERYGAEEALQVLWAAKTVHPDLFQDIDIEKETRFFYKQFFDYELSDSELAEILNSEINNSF
jgi:iron complex transport system substrate-binding protein